ncbi:hypothetical protein [Streptomyces sp. NPDC002403]
MQANRASVQRDILGGEPEDLADLQAADEDEAADYSRGKQDGLVLSAASELLQALVVLDEDAGLFYPASGHIQTPSKLVAMCPLQELADVSAMLLVLAQAAVKRRLVEVGQGDAFAIQPGQQFERGAG